MADALQIESTLLISQDTGTTDASLFGDSGVSSERLAQGFQFAATTMINRALLYLKTSNAPTDNVTLDVVSTLDGSSLSSATVAAAAIPAAYDYVTFTLSVGVACEAGTPYYLQLTRSGARDTVNCYRWATTTSDVYADGQRWARASGTWSSVAQDNRLILFGTSTDRFLLEDGSGVLLNEVNLGWATAYVNPMPPLIAQ